MRVKSPTHRRHHKLLTAAKGYRMARSRWYKVASEAVVHAGQYAFAGRHLKRRDLRATWIIRMNAALRPLGITYSEFIPLLKKAKIELDRKILSQLAISEPKVFSKIVDKAKIKV